MTAAEVLPTLIDAIRDAFERPDLQITRESTAHDVDGWDSLAHTVLIVNVETRFGVKLPRDRAFTVQNVGELADLVAAAVR